MPDRFKACRSKDGFELRRHLDGLIYRFVSTPPPTGQPGFHRLDADLWIIRHAHLGWVAAGFDSNDIYGLPWNQLSPQPDAIPPEGIWVSRKGSKSYVYDLVHI